VSQYIPLEKIDPWDKNEILRGISQKGEQMLESNLELGQHSTLLVIPKESDRYTALGGNNRLRKMRGMNYQEADCKVLTYGHEPEKGYYPIIDGREYRNAQGEIPKYFQTVEELEIALAFSHNTNPAFWNENEVINYMGNFPALEWKTFTAEFEEKASLQDIKNKFPEIEKDDMKDSPKPTLLVIFGTVEELQSARLEIEETAERFHAEVKLQEDK
jgi:hypothetical protein